MESIIQLVLLVLTNRKSSHLVKKIECRGILGHIFTNVLMHLDDLKCYENDRKNGIIIANLVDGFVSSFDMRFLKYVCDENHKCIVVFGVPYGTSL